MGSVFTVPVNWRQSVLLGLVACMELWLKESLSVKKAFGQTCLDVFTLCNTYYVIHMCVSFPWLLNALLKLPVPSSVSVSVPIWGTPSHVDDNKLLSAAALFFSFTLASCNVWHHFVYVVHSRRTEKKTQFTLAKRKETPLAYNYIYIRRQIWLNRGDNKKLSYASRKLNGRFCFAPLPSALLSDVTWTSNAAYLRFNRTDSTYKCCLNNDGEFVFHNCIF